MYRVLISLLQAKYNAACLERKSVEEQNTKMQAEITELKEALERSNASSKIEVSVTVFYTSPIMCTR